MSMQHKWLWAAVLSLATIGGCRQFGNTEAGALVGTGLGATTGALIGAGSGHAAGGALIGAATGAVAGSLVGNAADAREERDAAIAHAEYSQAQANAARQALTPGDVIHMTQQGVGDGVIVSALQAKGCRFSGDPQDIIQLKQAGVSDRVIQAMQTSPAAPYVPAPLPVYSPVPPAPPVVVVTPRPYPYYLGPRERYWGPRGPYHRYGYW